MAVSSIGTVFCTTFAAATGTARLGAVSAVLVQAAPAAATATTASISMLRTALVGTSTWFPTLPKDPTGSTILSRVVPLKPAENDSLSSTTTDDGFRHTRPSATLR